MVPEGGLFDSDLLEIPIPVGPLDLGDDSRIDLEVITYVPGALVDRVGPITWDPLRPGIDFDPSGALPDVPRQLGFVYDHRRVELHDSPGQMLLFHRLNGRGQRAELIEMELERPPVADAGGPYRVDEGEVLKLDGSRSSDANGDELAISWDLDGDGAFELSGPRPQVRMDDGPRNLHARIRVSDGTSAPVEKGFPVIVENVAPRVIAKVSGRAIDVRAEDPSRADSAAGFTFEFDLGGDGRTDAVRRGSAARLATAPTRASRRVRVTATDKDGGISAAAVVRLPGAEPRKRCAVPRLRGRTLAKARKMLRQSHCRIGRVKRMRAAKALGGQRAKRFRSVVVRQAPRPGVKRPAGAKVRVWVKLRGVGGRANGR